MTDATTEQELLALPAIKGRVGMLHPDLTPTFTRELEVQDCRWDDPSAVLLTTRLMDSDKHRLLLDVDREVSVVSLRHNTYITWPHTPRSTVQLERACRVLGAGEVKASQGAVTLIMPGGHYTWKSSATGVHVYLEVEAELNRILAMLDALGTEELVDARWAMHSRRKGWAALRFPFTKKLWANPEPGSSSGGYTP